MKKKMSVFSSCIISLFLAVFLSPANSHAITITPFTDWTLTINAKVINPVGEQPPPRRVVRRPSERLAQMVITMLFQQRI